MITSASHGQIKNIIQLQQKTKARRDRGLFVAEGLKMFQEAPDSWIEKVYIADRLYEEQEVQKRLESLPVEIVDDRIFRQISDTKTPQGILCLLRCPHYRLEKILEKENPLLMVLEDLQDPGNVGTIIRTAEGAGADGILLSKNTVDIFNPKVIRSTMGSIYRMPFVYIENMEEALRLLKKKKVSTYAAHLQGKNTYDGESYLRGTAFFVGNEGNGLSRQLSEKADCWIRIPMEGQVESLNAAMAAGILMYEAGRQRRRRV